MLFLLPSWLLPSSRSELQRLLGKKTMENEILKKPWSMVEQKMDCACALVAGDDD